MANKKGIIKIKNIMTRAWEIAREAVSNFGGKIIEYISGALKQAWEEVKNATQEVTRGQLQVIEGKLARNSERTNIEALRNAYEINIKELFRKDGAYVALEVTTDYNIFKVFISEGQWNEVA